MVAELGKQQQGVALPSEAVVRSPANEPIVWVKASAEHFVPQPVQTQPLDAQRVLVTRGLADNSRVVVQGASLINQIRWAAMFNWIVRHSLQQRLFVLVGGLHPHGLGGLHRIAHAGRCVS